MKFLLGFFCGLVVVEVANLATSREPSDLPAFMRETMKQLGL
jgi:putative intracellular protease/amidase